MGYLLNIFYSPGKVFEKLKEKPEWLKPLVIVMVVTALTAAIAVYLTRDTTIARQEEILRERGMTDEQIEQAKQFMTGPLVAISGAIGAIVFTTILMLIFAAIINILIPVFGGKGSFRSVFSVVSHAALIRVPSSILRLILMALTKSLYVTASLALMVPNLPKTLFVYKVLTGFDLFVIWEMIIVALGISITNQVQKKNAYVLVALIFIVSVFVGVALSGLGGRAPF